MHRKVYDSPKRNFASIQHEHNDIRDMSVLTLDSQRVYDKGIARSRERARIETKNWRCTSPILASPARESGRGSPFLRGLQFVVKLLLSRQWPNGFIVEAKKSPQTTFFPLDSTSTQRFVAWEGPQAFLYEAVDQILLRILPPGVSSHAVMSFRWFHRRVGHG